ncbi:hypothetical protein [Sulfuricurvum sp.]|uniref:hypothetical protein n=1 Tax=Sulfuricurvum sp. TaxID=2025608 RepID=UPI002E311B16|nr:hypothetical protein [Sulfuricurvum sp.]HEX5328644.1 hypothetical protein [Sulfuricurvum sp.]
MKHVRNFHRTRFGKIILSLLGVLIALYLLLFTSLGNRIMTPLIEKSLSYTLATPINVQEFALTRNRFHLLFQDNLGNTLSTQGGFSLLTLRMYAHYRIEGFQRGGFNPISKPFKTEGSLSGGIASFNIHGNGTILDGNIIYKIELHRFSLATMDVELTKIAYAQLMELLQYPSNTDTTISGKIALNGFDRRDVGGKIYLSTHTKRFLPTPITEDSNESVTLKSLLADPNGRVKPFHIDVELNVSLEHAGILEQFVGMPLGGKLHANGNIKGDEKHLRLNASSDVARSDATLLIEIPKLEPSVIIFDLKHADAEQAFALFALPAPLSGELSAYTELNSTDGKMQIVLTKATTRPDVLRDYYHITQPLIRFDATLNADLNKKGVHYRAAFKSDLARLEMDNTTTHDQMLRDLLKTIPSGSVRQ